MYVEINTSKSLVAVPSVIEMGGEDFEKGHKFIPALCTWFFGFGEAAQGNKCSAWARLLKIDIKDFYMSGLHSSLINASVSTAEDSDKSSLNVALEFLMGRQYARVSKNNKEGSSRQRYGNDLF